MNNNHSDIEKVLSKISFRKLSSEEQEHVWDNIVVAQNKPLSFILNQKIMFKSIIIALILVVGIGGTVAMADNSVPGDTLFGVDRAVENIRLSLAGTEKKNELRIAFAGERIKEIETINSSGASMSRPASLDVKESSVTRIEADVFRNETVIKIEYSDNKKFVFTSEAKTKTEVIDAIAKDFSALSKSFIESKLDFEIEDRSSKSDDKNGSDDLSSDDKIRVSTGINAALVLLNGVSTSLDGESAARLKLITEELNKYLTSLPQGSNVDMEINSEGNKTRVDLQTQDGRIRVEVKNNGEIKIKDDDYESDSDYYKNKSKDSDDDNELKDDDDEDEGDDDDDDNKSNLPPVVITLPTGGTVTSYTMSEVKLHNTQSNCWTVVNGSVYNVTSWISKHPGGQGAIVGMCGVDASSAFSGQHGGQSRPASELASFKIGVIK